MQKYVERRQQVHNSQATRQLGTSREQPLSFLVMPLCTCQHTSVNTRMPCCPLPLVPELTKIQERQRRGSYLVRVSPHCSPQAGRQGAAGMGQDLPWRDGLQTSLPLRATLSLLGIRSHVSRNCSFSFHNPNHKEMTGFRQIF